MGGSASKRPRPSYEDGKVRDPEIAEMQREAAEQGDDQKSALRDLIGRSAAQRADDAQESAS